MRGWSEDAWDPAFAYILVVSCETTVERFQVEVRSTAVMDMPGVSAGTSVSIVVVVPGPWRLAQWICARTRLLYLELRGRMESTRMAASRFTQ